MASEMEILASLMTLKESVDKMRKEGASEEDIFKTVITSEKDRETFKEKGITNLQQLFQQLEKKFN